MTLPYFSFYTSGVLPANLTMTVAIVKNEGRVVVLTMRLHYYTKCFENFQVIQIYQTEDKMQENIEPISNVQIYNDPP